MTLQKTSRRNLVLTTVAALSLLIFSASESSALNPQTDPPGSVAVGATTGQFARVSLVNNTDRVLGINPCVCPATLLLVDVDGETLSETAIEARPGAIESIDVSVPVRKRGSVLVRAYVEFTGEEGPRLACNIATRSSLALVDEETGKTDLVVPIATSFAASE